jgi:hypothetical protein
MEGIRMAKDPGIDKKVVATFPNLSTFQFGGTLPWWEGDTIELQCPDSYNLVTSKLERFERK